MSPEEYKTLREKVGNQDEVADLLGLSRPTISRREAGGRITEEAAIAIRELARTTKRRPPRKSQNAESSDRQP